MLEVLILPKFDELCLSVDTLKPHLVYYMHRKNLAKQGD